MFLFRAALGIVKFIADKLMSDDFSDVSWTLKNLALSDSDQDSLASTIQSIKIPVRARLDPVLDRPSLRSRWCAALAPLADRCFAFGRRWASPRPWRG